MTGGQGAPGAGGANLDGTAAFAQRLKLLSFFESWTQKKVRPTVIRRTETDVNHHCDE
jgi:hypothetical protein